MSRPVNRAMLDLAIELRKNALFLDDETRTSVPSKMDMFAWGMASGIRIAAGLCERKAQLALIKEKGGES